MEPLGIIVFSCIMGTAGFSVMLEAVRQLIDHAKTELPYEGAVIGALFGHLLPCPIHVRLLFAPAVCRGRGWPVCHIGDCGPRSFDTSRQSSNLWAMLWMTLLCI